MVYLYHRVHKVGDGNLISPSSRPKDKYTVNYTRREFSNNIVEGMIYLDDKIPIWNCLWEVLHFFIVNPKDIYSELRDAGSKIKGKTKWYKVDPKQLDKNMVIYSYKSRDFRKDFDNRRYQKLNNYSNCPIQPKNIINFH